MGYIGFIVSVRLWNDLFPGLGSTQELELELELNHLELELN